ncbi:MAG: glycosyltransferase [Desulfobacteraceae bacterium]|nr:glycosyltransferase [Desulfobacteraceae bacterium]
MGRKEKALHISFDYPDDLNPHKPKAVKNLIEQANRLDNFVISLNRTGNPFQEKTINNPNLCELKIFAPPFGVFLYIFLKRAARKIMKLLSEQEYKPDIVHGHKLTYEGIIAYEIWKRYAVPYVCTVRGNTDMQVLNWKPGYRKLYQRIVANSEFLFIIAPWIVGELKKKLVFCEKKTAFLPNFVTFPQKKVAGERSTSNKIISIFHLDGFRNKNIARLIKAVDLLNDEGFDLELHIAGKGKSKTKILEMIEKTKRRSHFRLLGHIKNEELPSFLVNYFSLAMPSIRESFGIVYLEALSCGLPILYSKNRGMDGYFSGYLVGESVNPLSVNDIKDKITKIFLNQTKYRSEVLRMKSEHGLERFTRASVAKTYEDQIINAVQRYKLLR